MKSWADTDRPFWPTTQLTESCIETQLRDMIENGPVRSSERGGSVLADYACRYLAKHGLARINEHGYWHPTRQALEVMPQRGTNVNWDAVLRAGEEGKDG